jgi:hypothetical protein
MAMVGMRAGRDDTAGSFDTLSYCINTHCY